MGTRLPARRIILDPPTHTIQKHNVMRTLAHLFESGVSIKMPITSFSLTAVGPTIVNVLIIDGCVDCKRFWLEGGRLEYRGDVDVKDASICGVVELEEFFFCWSKGDETERLLPSNGFGGDDMTFFFFCLFFVLPFFFFLQMVL